MLAQTFPTTQNFPAGTPAWAIGLAVVLLALGGVIGGLVVLLPLLPKVIEAIKGSAAATAEAKSATAVATQAQGHAVSLDRQMTTIALNTPAPNHGKLPTIKELDAILRAEDTPAPNRPPVPPAQLPGDPR